MANDSPARCSGITVQHAPETSEPRLGNADNPRCGKSMPAKWAIRCPSHSLNFQGWATGMVHPRCRNPMKLGCDACGMVIFARCSSSNVDVCEPCGTRYRRRVAVIADSGRKMYPGGTLLMITLTAPGVVEHYLPNGKRCPCTPEGGIDLAVWNWQASPKFHRWIQSVRRAWGLDIQYFKAAEVQERGALHFHVLVRVPDGMTVTVGALRRLSLKHDFGHAVDIAPVVDERASRYVAKYVSKASGERRRVPWAGVRVDDDTGEVIPTRPTFRTWTCSRRWGLTMKAVRERQAAYAFALSPERVVLSLMACAGILAVPPQAALDSKMARCTSGGGGVPLGHVEATSTVAAEPAGG